MSSCLAKSRVKFHSEVRRMENQAPPSSSSSPTRLRLLDEAKSAPTDPGVYLMRDAEDTILYVGKAKNIRNRITSYFQRAPHDIPRTELMVQRVERFELILTKTEDEALILECTLIKKHKPKYNVRLKDDKQYPYVRIAENEDFPRVEWTRRVRRDGARYFGPFPSGYSAKMVVRYLTESFRLRDCSDNTFRHRSRPCILYQMHRCTAPCVQHISRDDYKASILDVIRVLEGRNDSVKSQIEREMMEASEREEYESATYFRDLLYSLSSVVATQSVDEAGSARNRDVIAIEREGADGHAVVLQIRGGKMVSVKHIRLSNTDVSQTDAEVLREFMSQYYLELKAEREVRREAIDKGEDVYETPGAVFSPDEALIEDFPDDQELLERALGIKVKKPQSEMEKQLITVAKTNCRHALSQSKKGEGGHGIQALEEVQEKIQLEKLPTRIECYDISNIQGEDAVASRVVFIDGAPDKNLYRRYKIRTVKGANDFAMMKEVLGRRFANEEDRFPDLVVVDGGKGQLAQAVAILEELSIQGVEVVGLAKARTESDFQKTEVESSLERIFIPGRKNPVGLLPHTAAYKLLVHVRDEAHRFAVSYHRLVRDKRTIRGKN